jgi:hypothetical protein
MTTFDSETSPPEALLALAVIEQAFRDIRATRIASNRRGGAAHPRKGEVEEARLFLTAEGGAWAKARSAYCALAGLHPDRVREIALTTPPNTDTRSQSSAAERGRGA